MNANEIRKATWGGEGQQVLHPGGLHRLRVAHYLGYHEDCDDGVADRKYLPAHRFA